MLMSLNFDPTIYTHSNAQTAHRGTHSGKCGSLFSTDGRGCALLCVEVTFVCRHREDKEMCQVTG